jgi:hypothetical protein
MAQYDIPLRINKSKLKSGVWPYVTFSKGKIIMNTLDDNSHYIPKTVNIQIQKG